ncbi:MAG: hypothetical protein JJ913_13875 [Rhizobiaceae bacterium]|nr:hypothetical protein [Rhizobiaceae bacterium]
MLADEPAGPRPVDILLTVKRADEVCSLDLRLTFFPSAQPSIDGYDLVGVVGRSGMGYGTFSLPYGTDYHDGILYVSDCSNEIVQWFSESGMFLGGFSGFGSRIGLLDHEGKIRWISANADDDQFAWNRPYYIEHDEVADRFVVSNRGANELAFVSMDGRKLGVVGGVLDYPHEVAVDHEGNIYVADTNNHSLFIYRGEDLTPKRLNFPESYGLPKTVAVNRDGRLAVGFVGAGAASAVARPEQRRAGPGKGCAVSRG